MAGSLLLFAAALSTYRINQVQPVSVTPSEWSWLSNLQLKLDAGQQAYGPFLSEAQMTEATPAPVTKPHRASRIQKVFKRAHSLAVHHPRVKQSHVAHIPAEAPRAVTNQAPTVQAPMAPTAASVQELTTLQDVRKLFHQHLILALTTQPTAAKALIAAIGPQQKNNIPTGLTKPVASHWHLVSRHKKTKPANPSQPIDHSSSVVMAKSETPTPTTTLALPVVAHASATTQSKQDQVAVSQAAPAAEAPVVMTAAPTPQAAITAATYEGPIVQANETFPAVAQTSGDEADSDAPDAQPVTVSFPLLASAAQSQKQNGYSVSPAHVNTQIPAAPPAPPVTPAPQPKTHAAYSMAMTAMAVMDTQLAIPMVEAFDWVTPVSGGQYHQLTQESKDGAGWVLTQAQDHWPTLARTQADPIPLISQNAGRLLSTLDGAVLQSEAGILFGKVPAGWGVRLSGRAEHPVFLNQQNQSVSPSSLDGERYFAFLNVAPGAHLLYLTNGVGAEEGAVGVAVLSGTSTYVDFSSATRTTVKGRVFDGSESRTKPLAGVSVRLLGSSTGHTETDSSGRFTIENAITIADYPMFFETDAPNGYTHRYQVQPSSAESVFLFRLNATVIQSYLGQLEGTISPESGLVIAALPNLIAEQGEKAKLTPAVRSIAPSPTLRPELYTLSSSGQLQVDVPADLQNSRFVSVQVPEGPAITGLTDKDQHTVWSEMIMASPAVVNLVGPY